MITTVYHDESAPKRARWRVMRATDILDDRWIITESFPTEREANAFARGFTLGAEYTLPPEPIPDRIDRALDLVKSARDDYRRECRELRDRVRELETVR